MRQATKEPFRILFVCLGNICRSPTAEGALRHLCAAEAPALDIEVDSAGTGDYHLGEPPDPRSRLAAAARGIDLSRLRARRVERQDFTRFDLVLAMDRRNLRALRALCPPGSRARVELFLEFAGEPGEGEVPDPYTGTAADFERVLDLVIPACRRLIARLQERAH
ncbi:MAG: low molecular weight protein-tyrosine-phosphatase [Steroidobacteraceae bacterium]|jgi:protein-tyrosine phosphatase